MVTQINNLINLGINYRFQLYIFFHSNNNIEPSLKIYARFSSSTSHILGHLILITACEINTIRIIFYRKETKSKIKQLDDGCYIGGI